jgi:hypothetical protein
MKNALAWLAMVSMLCLSAASHAQDAAGDRENEARARFRLGQLYYSQARFADAAREFRAAYETLPHPALLHNIYLALRDQGDIPGAVDALTRYLADATDLNAAERRLLEARLATMRHQLPEQPQQRDPEPQQGDPEPQQTDPEHVEEGQTPEHHEVGVELSSPEAQPSGGGGIGIVPGIITTSVGGAALIGAIISGAIAESIRGERDSMCTLADGACPPTVDQAGYASRFSTARDTAWGLLIAGGVTAAVGGVLLGLGASEHTDTPVVAGACDGQGCYAVIGGRM